MKSRVFFIYALGAYAAGTASIAYIAGFLAEVAVPKGIGPKGMGDGDATSLWAAVLVDAVLVGLFGLHHSLAARASFKRRWTTLVPPPIERATFLYMTAAVTALLVVFWRPYAPLLSGSKRFIAYSQRYFGTEDWPDAAKHFSREVHVADLIGLVEALGAGPVHLVTWSYGGEVASYAMLRRPDLFRSAVHFEPSLGALLAEVEGGAEAQTRFAATLEPAIEALSAGRSEAAAFLFIDAVFGLPPGTMAREPAPAPALVRDNARTLAPILRMAPGAPLSCADLAALDKPVLILRGELTQARYRMAAEAMAACLPKARLATMVEVGHDGPYWPPEDFAAMIKAFHAALP